MEQLNLDWFKAINAGADLHGTALMLAIFAAKYLMDFVFLGLLVLWLWGELKYRNIVILAVIGAYIALCINWLIGVFWYHPRPFVLGIGHTYLNHAPDSSFPSDHATFICTLSFIFLWQEKLQGWVGFSLLLITFVIAWARIYVGVHYPFDMIGSLIVSLMAIGIMVALVPWLEKRVLPIVEYVHQKITKIGLLLPKRNS